MKTKSKNKKLRIALGICIPLIIIIAAALAVVMKYGPTFGFYLVPPSAERYGKDALATIGKSGIYSGSDEWKSTYEECLKMIENAESYEDTYPAIKKALSVCGGKHSMLMTKSESQDTTESYDEVLPTVSLDGDIAIIKLPDFLVTAEDFLVTAEAGQKYAKVAEDFIHENRDKIKGVVLDLRGNIGGDMGPMATAVSSLLPDGELVYYHYRSYDIPVTLKKRRCQQCGHGRQEPLSRREAKCTRCDTYRRHDCELGRSSDALLQRTRKHKDFRRTDRWLHERQYALQHV